MAIEIIEYSHSLVDVRPITTESLVKTRYQELIEHITIVDRTPQSDFHEHDMPRVKPFLHEDIPALKEVFHLHVLKTKDQRAALVENFEAGSVEATDLETLKTVFTKLVAIINADPGLHRQSYVPLANLRTSLKAFIQWVEKKPQRDHREMIRARRQK